MPSTAPPSTTPILPGRRSRRTLLFDRLAILVLGASAFVLSFNSLRQIAVAIHTDPTLSFLFPIVIDGFIAYGIRALLVLREAPLPARLYAWALFSAATAASLWANALHSVRLNGPGIHVLNLGNHTVAILSAIAPLALGGATHLHILITRYGGTDPARARVDGITGPVPYRRPEADGTPPLPAPEAPQRPEPHGLPEPQQSGPARTADADADAAAGRNSGGVDLDIATGTVPTAGPQGGPEDAAEGSVRRVQGQGGRPPMAPLERLTEVIAAAHPDPEAITHDSARKALTASGLGAGTHRLAEAITLARTTTVARQHPDQLEARQPLADRT